MDKWKFTAEIEISLTAEDIDDIMASALEGGICYWADRAVVAGEYLGEFASDQISRGGTLNIHLVEPFDEEDNLWYELNRDKFINGFKLWLESGGDVYSAVTSDGAVDTYQIDGTCADCIVQLALFGEVVFG